MTGDWRASSKQSGRQGLEEVVGMGENNILKYTV